MSAAFKGLNIESQRTHEVSDSQTVSAAVERKEYYTADLPQQTSARTYLNNKNVQNKVVQLPRADTVVYINLRLSNVYLFVVVVRLKTYDASQWTGTESQRDDGAYRNRRAAAANECWKQLFF